MERESTTHAESASNWCWIKREKVDNDALDARVRLRKFFSIHRSGFLLYQLTHKDFLNAGHFGFDEITVLDYANLNLNPLL